MTFELVGQGERTAVFPSDLTATLVISLCSTVAIPKIRLKNSFYSNRGKMSLFVTFERSPLRVVVLGLFCLFVSQPVVC